MWEVGGRWVAAVQDTPVYLEVTGTSQRSCVDELRAHVGDDVTLTVEVIPRIVGVAEAAEIMGWDKRRVVTYIDRGSFPEPIVSLASGRIWLRDDVEAFSERWHARQRERRAGPAATPDPATEGRR